MASINLEDLEEGMVLSADAKDANGRVLLRAGTALIAKHLTIFKTWGILSADIAGVSREDVEASHDKVLDPIALEKADEILKVMFKHTDLLHPAIAELYRLRRIELANSPGKPQ